MFERRSARNGVPPCRTAAFSLIEMLVVLTIMSIAMALLLPAVLLSRRHGQTAKCINNLRQIGFAMENFAADYDDLIPQELMTDAFFHEVMSARTDLWRLLPTAHAGNSEVQSMSDYFEDKRVLKCPSMRLDEAWSYGLNGQVLSAFKRYRDIKDPTETPMVFDSEQKVGHRYSDLAMRHYGCAQILYADMHVDTVYHNVCYSFTPSVPLPPRLDLPVWARFPDEYRVSVVVGSYDKDLSNVVLEFSDGAHQKFEGIRGHELRFEGTGSNQGKEIVGVWIKAGAYLSGDGPGYGWYVLIEDYVPGSWEWSEDADDSDETPGPPSGKGRKR